MQKRQKQPSALFGGTDSRTKDLYRNLHAPRQRNGRNSGCYVIDNKEAVPGETLEVPRLIPEAIQKNGTKGHVILVDCLTLWINNLLRNDHNPENIDNHIQKLTQSIEKVECPVILVSNEVGTGIVPENNLARLYRDITGFANQKIAACVDRVIWMVAGIPVKIK